MTWQTDLLEGIRTRAPAGSTVEPYGSVTEPGTLDGWSDVDVALTLTADVDAETLLGGTPWAWQEHQDGATQTVRLVLVDGRRVDLTVQGERVRLPASPVDASVRFDAALAAVRFGRGNDLIGMHLVLGIVRTALVDVMIAVDRATGTDHHRSGSPLDARASEASALLAGPLGPELALRAAEFAGRCRSEIDPDHRADWSGLRAVIASGAGG
ncbi:hypothetical protein [Curtobacterium pusillum]|uniref:hypothetical protein n=1 Tax=Curtobacterium pusillum TaxID=69373 RepID=UPI0011A18C29|nr:hypothetical protein [Curtobacterium pusillum]